MLLHSRARRLSLLGSRHPLAALLSGMDVCGHDRTGLAQKSLGILHRNLRRRFMGLRESGGDYLLLQRTGATFAVDAYRTSCTHRPSHRGAGMVLEFVHRGGLLVGVSPAAEEIVQRFRQIRSDTCA